MIRWILILTGVLLHLACFSQGSFSADIADAKNISDDRIEQINALEKILVKRKYSSFPDSLGLIHYAIAYRHRILGDHLNVIRSAEAGIEKFKLQDYKGYQLPFLYSFLGESYTTTGELDKAIDNYQLILDQAPEGRAITVYGYAAFQASDIYRNVEDYSTALDFIEYVTNGAYADELSLYDLMDLHLSASICHSNLQANDALSNAQKSLDIARATAEQIEDIDNWQLLELDQQQAFIDLVNGNKHHAASLFEKNLSAVKTLANQDPTYRIDAADIASNISYTYQESGDYQKAYDYASEALHLLPDGGEHDYTTTELLIGNNRATALQGLGRLPEALKSINETLNLIPKNEWASSKSKKLILQALFDKAMILSKSQNTEAALDVILQLDSLFDSHVDDQLSSYSVRNLRAKGTKYYQFGIDLAYQAKNTNTYWQLSEKMKGLQLLEANLANQNNSTSPTHASLNKIKKEILMLNYKIDHGSDEAIIDSLQLKLSEAKKERIATTQKIKSEDQSNLHKITSITALQEQISDEIIIQYQAGSTALYGLAITKDKIDIQQLASIEDIIASTTQLRELVKNPNSNLSSVNKICRQLYDQLIGPFDISGRRIVIILDERLYTLPFDILQNDDGDYLITTNTISYHISGSFWTHDQESDDKKVIKLRSINLIQPEYDSNSGLSPLPFAVQEGELIEQSYQLEITKGASIAKPTFDSIMQEAAVLHYSGHAMASIGDGERSYLALSGNNQELSNRLLLGELYTNKTNAQMVVLSACNTGTGDIIKGEGVESLTRGFIYAGAQSVINTLWTVDDQSTASIVGDMYTQLKTGEQKDEALRIAKINYLSNSEAFLRHPYYWSGIIAVGDVSPLEEYHINWLKHLFILLLFGVLAWFLTWRHSKRPFPKLEFFPKAD